MKQEVRKGWPSTILFDVSEDALPGWLCELGIHRDGQKTNEENDGISRTWMQIQAELGFAGTQDVTTLQQESHGKIIVDDGK